MNKVMPGSDGLRILGDFFKKKQLVEIRTWAKWVDFFGPGRDQSSGVYEIRRALLDQMELSV